MKLMWEVEDERDRARDKVIDLESQLTALKAENERLHSFRNSDEYVRWHNKQVREKEIEPLRTRLAEADKAIGAVRELYERNRTEMNRQGATFSWLIRGMERASALTDDYHNKYHVPARAQSGSGKAEVSEMIPNGNAQAALEDE
jgi:chromosome segregation ATPase